MSELRPVGRHPAEPKGDIVFVHGLGGDWRATWMVDPDDDGTFWPLWLARDLPGCRTWSLDYEGDLTAWGGSVMDIEEHGDTILEILKVRGLGDRPIVFLVHSLGGLVTKSLLRTASESSRYGRIATSAQGIVFFATPNSGARLASLGATLLSLLGPLGMLVRSSPVLQELRANRGPLRRLNRWYRDVVAEGGLGGRAGVQIFYEKAGPLRAPFLIVDETSADPGIPSVKPLPLAMDHSAICKLAEPTGWLYQSVCAHVRDAIDRLPSSGDPELDRLVAAAKAEARREVEALRLELALKDQVIAAKDETIDALRSMAMGRHGPEPVRGAIAAYAHGDPEPAENVTQQRAEQRAALARANAGVERLSREAAADFRQLAALSYGHDTGRSLAAYRRAVDLDPHSFAAWIWIARLEQMSGRLAEARTAVERAHDLARRSGERRDLHVILVARGDLMLLAGDRSGALGAFREGLAIVEELGREDPERPEWQRDRSISLNKIGDLLLLAGDRAGALQAFRDGLAIREELARRDPGRIEWQRDRSVSLNRIGDVLLLAGDRAGALRVFREGLAIRDELVQREPESTGWPRDRFVSLVKIGDVLLIEGERQAALRSFREGLAIMQDLARRDPANTEWRRDHSVCLNKIAEVLLSEDDRDGALRAFREVLSIRESLAGLDPSNTEWQRDRAVSLNRIGDVLRLEGDHAGAFRMFSQDLAITSELAGRDPGNAGWQRDLIMSHWNLAELHEKEPGERAEARTHWREALRLARALAAKGKLLPADAWFIPEIERRLGPSGS